MKNRREIQPRLPISDEDKIIEEELNEMVGELEEQLLQLQQEAPGNEEENIEKFLMETENMYDDKDSARDFEQEAAGKNLEEYQK